MKKGTDQLPPMVPYIGHHVTTTWLLRNYEIVNERIWDPHYELSLFRLFDQSFRTDSPFHFPFLPEITRNFLKSKRILPIPYYGNSPFLLHKPIEEDEFQDILAKMRGFYHNQMEAKGDITEEFQQYCLRQIARSLQGRTGMDLARMWIEISGSKHKLPTDSKNKNIIVARNSTLYPNPTFSSNIYLTFLSGQSEICLNDHFICAASPQSLTIIDIYTGEAAQYQISNIKFIQPIVTGGFVIASHDGHVVTTIKQFNKFSKVFSVDTPVSSLKASSGLQTTFAIVDSTRKYLIFGTETQLKFISFDESIVDFDVINKKVYVATNPVGTMKGKVILLDDATKVAEWDCDSRIKTIKWSPEMKLLGVIAEQMFAWIDPRCTLQAQRFSLGDNILDFSFSPVHRFFVLFRTDSIEFYDENSGLLNLSFLIKPEGGVTYLHSWMKNDDILSIFTGNGSYIVLSPELRNPLLENISIIQEKPIFIQTSLDTVLLRSETKATIISTNPKLLFIPSSI